MQCPRCGSTGERTIPGPFPGGHHAKLVCDGCGRWIAWLKKPEPPAGSKPSPDVLALVHPRTKPCPLEGTASQTRFARSVRERLLYQARKAGRPRLAAFLICVADATWFIANQKRGIDALRWPSADQMENPNPTGRCANCGEPSYGFATCCSEECTDEYAAYCMGEEATR